MGIGERIRLFRNLRNITQTQLGIMVGFNKKSAKTRISHYENGRKAPKKEMINKLAYALGVSPEALSIPEKVTSEVGMMHTLFALEDLYDLKISNIDGKLCLTLNESDDSACSPVLDRLRAWHQEAEKLEKGEISKKDYDNWRYRYPRVEAERFEAELRERLNQKNQKQ